MQRLVHLRMSNRFLFLLLVPVLAWADTEPLPEPLSLEFALSQASSEHPQLQIVAAELERARAEQLQAQADTGFEATLSARLRWIGPQPVSIDQSPDDHRLSLSVNKPLYDFGRSAAKEQASRALMQGREFDLQDGLTQHRIAIMAAFFDVLLADQAYARDTEEMSMTYIRFDRAQQRNELGQLSDIEVMETRSLFQASRFRQAQSVAAQRTTRAYLANLLNRPEHLPSELQAPLLDLSKRKIPDDIDAWLAELEQGNTLLLSMKAQQQSAKAQLDLALADDNPRLNGRVEVSEYTRDFGGNDIWRAGVSLEVPLFTGGRSGALQAVQRAELRKAAANYEQLRRSLRQRLLEVWTELQTLKVTQQRLIAERDFRELYLDRSRARYDLEVATDFGDSMVFMSALRHRMMTMAFSTALAWARVDAMLGRDKKSVVVADAPGDSGNGGEKK
jgi:outer membrane protein TolC